MSLIYKCAFNKYIRKTNNLNTIVNNGPNPKADIPIIVVRHRGRKAEFRRISNAPKEESVPYFQG